MPASIDIHVPRIKPGDRVTWLYSKKRSFVLGYGVQRVPAEVVRVCKHRIRIKINQQGSEKLVNVHPENVISKGHPE
jgi:hypothetical protein